MRYFECMQLLKIAPILLLSLVFMKCVKAQDYYFILSPQRVFTYGSGNINLELNYNDNLRAADFKVEFVGSGLSVFGRSALAKKYEVQVKSFTEMYGSIYLLITHISSGIIYKSNIIKVYNNDLYKNYVLSFSFNPIVVPLPKEDLLSSWTPPPPSNLRLFEVLKLMFEFNKGLTYIIGFLLGILLGFVPIMLKF